MLTTRMRPKMSEKPLATMNSSPANVSPFSSVRRSSASRRSPSRTSSCASCRRCRGRVRRARRRRAGRRKIEEADDKPREQTADVDLGEAFSSCASEPTNLSRRIQPEPAIIDCLGDPLADGNRLLDHRDPATPSLEDIEPTSHPEEQMSDTYTRRDPVRVDGPARDRRHRRRVEEAPRHARRSRSRPPNLVAADLPRRAGAGRRRRPRPPAQALAAPVRRADDSPSSSQGRRASP